MNDLARVQEWFRRGLLLPPAPAASAGAPPSSVDLALALAGWAGAQTPPPTDASRAIRARLRDPSGADPQQLIFVLIDGLGCNLLAGLPLDAWLRRAPITELRAVFPSTTAAAITSLASGAWPAQHGAPGWFTYLPQHDLTATILPFVERFQGAPLQTLGVQPASVFPATPLARSMRATFCPLHPASIAGSVYTRHHWGDQAQAYGSLADGVTRLLDALTTTPPPSLHFLYIPSVDTAEHRHGLESPEAAAALAAVDTQLARLAAALPPHARLVVSSDHGMLTVPEQARLIIAADDPLLAHLRAPPSGEPRVPFFHLRPGRIDAFAAEFRHRFGEHFALLTTQQSDELRLWGPRPLSALTRDRVGDFIALSAGPEVFLYAPRPVDSHAAGSDRTTTTPPPPYENVRGFHAGLTPDEMRIPLIVA